ncbi:hypothetical protein NPIL_180131, partial [Nephila pilipes]
MTKTFLKTALHANNPYLKNYLREQSGQDINENQEDLSEDEKIALLGKPRLGEQYKVQIRIKESREFK